MGLGKTKKPSTILILPPGWIGLPYGPPIYVIPVLATTLVHGKRNPGPEPP